MSVEHCSRCGRVDFLAAGDKLCGTCMAEEDKWEERRDQAANAALTGLLSYEETCCIDTDEGKANLARDAYRIADAMLAEREIVRDKAGGIPAGKQPSKGEAE